MRRKCRHAALLELEPGDEIALSADGFGALAEGVLDELRAKYLED